MWHKFSLKKLLLENNNLLENMGTLNIDAAGDQRARAGGRITNALLKNVLNVQVKGFIGQEDDDGGSRPDMKINIGDLTSFEVAGELPTGGPAWEYKRGKDALTEIGIGTGKALDQEQTFSTMLTEY